MNISSNIASIQTQQSYMDKSAQNIANVNNNTLPKQIDLTKEMIDQISIEKTVQANTNAIKSQDEMFGSLLDIKV